MSQPPNVLQKKFSPEWTNLKYKRKAKVAVLKVSSKVSIFDFKSNILTLVL